MERMSIRTERREQLVDVTDLVAEAVARARLDDGRGAAARPAHDRRR